MNKLKNQKTLVFEWMKKPEKKIKSNQKFLEKNLLKKCSNLNLKTNKKNIPRSRTARLRIPLTCSSANHVFMSKTD